MDSVVIYAEELRRGELMATTVLVAFPDVRVRIIVPARVYRARQAARLARLGIEVAKGV